MTSFGAPAFLLSRAPFAIICASGLMKPSIGFSPPLPITATPSWMSRGGITQADEQSLQFGDIYEIGELGIH